MRVLVVDDDARSRIALIKALRKARYEVMSFESVPPALEYLAKNQVDAALIDLVLPGPNGLMLAERLRLMKPACPILLISHHAQLGDMEKAFQAGIDDFVLRPVKPLVLLERLAKAMMRRTEITASARPHLPHLEVDTTRRIIHWFGKPLKLTPKEMQLLACLTSDSDRYFSYSNLYAMMYGERLSNSDACYKLRALLHRLRRKLEAGGIPRVIEGERSLGFRWNHATLQQLSDPQAQLPINPE